MGRISKGERCSVSGCSQPAVKSVPLEKASRAGLSVSGSRRAYLCEQHYKELKKRLKKEKRIEKWRWR